MEKKMSGTYRLIKGLVKLFYPKMQVEGLENLPEEPAVIVANHCKMNGPIACELYFPGNRYTWCAGEMMQREEVASYAYADFWSRKPRWSRPFYKLLSHLIAPLSVCVFNQANTIGVYHDSRVLSTFRNTVKRLQEGAHVVVFPEHDAPYNHILCQFQDRFIDVARMYYKRTGKALQFVPMYIAPELKVMYLGAPIRFLPGQPMEMERERICRYLMEQITAIACGLPEHTVVPYQNIPRSRYGSNRSKEASFHA